MGQHYINEYHYMNAEIRMREYHNFHFLFFLLLSPFSTWRICSREAKNKSWECDWSAKKIAEKKLDQFLLFYSACANKFALVEQENGPSLYILKKILKGKAETLSCAAMGF